MLRYLLAALSVAGTAAALAPAPALIQNGGFEAVSPATPGVDGLVSGWRLGEPPQVPSNWSLNSAYPGQFAIGTAAPHSGERFVRLEANSGKTAHIYQMCVGLEPGKWYRVSAWTRGDPVAI